jgi:diacylglycerol kinase (ATP)
VTAKVILNPYAGRWTGQKRRQELENALQNAGIEYELVVTDYPGHGTELAASAVQDGYHPIISAGGDGSLSEVVNGILQGSKILFNEDQVPLGMLPLGSANDFAISLGLPKDFTGAAQTIARGNTRRIDIGHVIYGAEKQERYFANNSAIGLEPCVTLVQQGIKRLRGVFRYLVAALIAISRNPQWIMELEWEGGSYSGMVNLVTVGNNPLTGGFYMTPHANPFDGLLTFVYGSIPSRLQILAILPRAMKPGKGSYVEHPAVHEIHSPWLRIHTNTPTPLHADGEIQSETIQDLEYRILPACLPLLM